MATDSTQTVQTVSRISNRRVWVINHDKEEYVEKFKATTYRIPPNGEKKVLLPFLTARKFLAQGKPPAEQNPADRTWLVKPKALQTIELTEEERKKLDGGLNLEAEAKKETEAFKNMCMICNKKLKTPAVFKAHMAKEHPDAVQAEDDDA